MADTYDAVVVGGGVVGASVLFHLTELGCRDVLLVDRGPIAGGGTGKSCGIVRTHYSVFSNTKLAVESLRILRDFPTALHDPDADSGFVNSGYLILGDDGETAGALVGNVSRQHDLGANTYLITPEEAASLHPLLDLSGVSVIGYEPESGYADAHLTATSFVRAAGRRGARVRSGVGVTQILVDGGRAHGVRTDAGDIHADLVLIALGPWTAELTTPLGIEIPLTTYRHTVLTMQGTQPYSRDLPVVKDLTTANKMYFRPAHPMVLVGTGDAGDRTDDPDAMSGEPAEELVVEQGRQIARRLDGFADPQLTGAWFGPYDVTPDWNPIIDAAPGVAGLYLACGFSGHGFKLAPIVGKLLAQFMLQGQSDPDLSPYRHSRFAEGAELVGAYGVGSIS